MSERENTRPLLLMMSANGLHPCACALNRHMYIFIVLQCIAAGSSIMNREVESASMRPLAKALTKQLDLLRSLLRDQCLRNQYTYSEKVSYHFTVLLPC